MTRIARQQIGLVAVLVCGLCSTSAAGTISYLPITNDADSGIAPSNYYTHAIDFGTHDNGAVVNGVPFAKGLVNSLPANFTYTVSSGLRSDHGGNGGGNVTGAVTDLFYDMIYNGSNAANGTATLTFRGLVPGREYDTRIYTRQWGAGSRTSNISFDTNGDAVAENQVTISEDNASVNPPGFAAANQAYALSYKFTADSNKLQVTFQQIDANWSWHVYGVSNELVAGPPLALVNPSFEADTFTVDPGYVSGNGPITGWRSSADARVGLNPATTSPFANNGVIPNGRNVALIQASNGTEWLDQRVFGFEPEDTYLVTFFENSRSGYGTPNVDVKLGADTIVPTHPVPAVGGAAAYRYIGSKPFAPTTAGAYDLRFTNTAPNDATALIDNVGLHRIWLQYRDNFNAIANSYTINPSANDAPGRQGGLFASLTYSENPHGDNLTQLDNTTDDALFMAPIASSSLVTASPDHNFVDFGTNAHYVLQYKVDPANGSNTDDWGAMVFGSSSQTASVNSSDGIGFLIRGNGGWQVFDGTLGGNVMMAQGTLPGGAHTGFYDVRINYMVPTFDDATKGYYSIFVDDQFVAGLQTRGGFANNYLVMAAYGSAGDHSFTWYDDLQLWATVPEPGTIVLMLLGVPALVGLVRRRAKKG